MINKIEFGKRLLDLRVKCGLSQSKLADMMFISGQAVSKWETGSSLPDIELLIPLARILGVTADYLLNGESKEFTNDTVSLKTSLTGYDITDDNTSILTAMSDTLSREYLYKAAKYLELDKLKYTFSIGLMSEIDGTQNHYKSQLNINDLSVDTLQPFSRQLSNITLQAINKSYNPVQEIIDCMRCPKCKNDLKYIKNSGEEYLTCGEHRYNVNDGVVDFGTLEIPGYTWSSWIRGYDDYKKRYSDMHNNKMPEISKLCIDEIKKSKPQLIIDIGSGCMGFAGRFIKTIDWECVLVLTDLSHRILKYDKYYVDEVLSNPKVKVVYLACDVRNFPFKDDSAACIASMGGFEGVSYRYLDSYKESIRVLKHKQNAVFSISLVSDKKNLNVQKWLNLIKSEAQNDQMMMDYYNQIFDIREWHELLPNLGFTAHTLTKLSEEIPPPDDDKFPYDCEISRWMGIGIVVAEK